jgi:hypothetical protein
VTRIIARLILAMLLLPFAGVVLLVGFGMSAMIGGTTGGREMLIAWIVTDIFVVVYWVGIWRAGIVWTSKRVTLTFASAGLGAFASALVIVVLRDGAGLPVEPTMLFGNSLFPMVFVLSTVILWRESPAERHARITERGTDTVSCPICANNMTGLRAAKCPECGAVFTLDELLTSQANASREDLGQG